jgi:tetratricopeptide (TPR) repeat protein
LLFLSIQINKTFTVKNNLINCILFLCCAACLQAQERQQFVSGTITSLPDNEPVANAIVTIKGTFNETETISNGTFRIAAIPGDELVINALFKHPMVVPVNNVQQDLRIQLETNTQLLETITLSEKKETEVYIKEGFVKKRKDVLGHSYENHGDSFISGIDMDMYTVARKIPFVEVVGDPAQGQVVYNTRMRGALGGSKVPMQVIVDGILVDQNVLATINPMFVTNVAIQRSLAGTITYGAQGAGGIMYITTKNSPSTNSKSTNFASFLAKGNDYNERVLPISENNASATKPYVNEIEKYTNVDDALRYYEEKRKEPNSSTLTYYLDMSDYFGRWGHSYSYKILSDLYKQNRENPRVLMAIAFKLEEDELLLQASYVLEELLELRPTSIQAYRDVARLYASTGRYNVAATLYKQMMNNTIPNVKFNSIRPIIFNEYRHLITNYKRYINYNTIPNELLALDFKKDVRIVLEYTSPLAEFEVQFVSPSKKYYTWKHTHFKSKNVIENEIENGFALKEFIIEDLDKGKWLINVKPIGKSTGMTATLIKYTLYQNYGLKNEQKTIKVINLENQKEKVTLDSFIY